MSDVTASRTSTHGFLFADLRDYSTFVEDHGDRAAADLLARYRTLVRTVIAMFQGAEVRTEGDSFYVVFPSASSAVSGGMAILAAAAGAEPPLRVGVGVHAGETADTGEGPVGSAVNIAARVCAQASAGELLATDTVRTLTRTLVPFRFINRGTPQLKGIAEPIALYRVADPDDPEVAAAALRAAKARPRSTPVARTASLPVVAIAAGLAAVVVAAAFMFSRAAGPRATSSPPASGVAATASLTAPGLSQLQAALVARLPLELQSSCQPSTPEKTATGATTSVTCAPAFGQGASSATYGDYGTNVALLLDTFQKIKTAQGDPGGDCARTATASGAWSFGDAPSGTFMSGSLLCYLDRAGQAQLVWTYESGDGQGILASASRADRDSKALYGWWFQVRGEILR